MTEKQKVVQTNEVIRLYKRGYFAEFIAPKVGWSVDQVRAAILAHNNGTVK